LTMAQDTNADDLITKLKAGNPTVETLEAARAILRAYKFTQISERIFRLAELVRERMNRD
jgi:hypothetical protein